MGTYSSDSDSKDRHRRHRSRSHSSSLSRKRKHKKLHRRKHSSSESRSRSISRSRRSRSRSYHKSHNKRKKSKHQHHRRRSSSSSSRHSDKYKSKSHKSSKSNKSESRDQSSENDVQILDSPVAPQPLVEDMTSSETLERKKMIDSIENDSFMQQNFSSSRSSKQTNSKEQSEDFDFGTIAELKAKNVIQLAEDSLYSPYLFGDPLEREEKYIRRILSLRAKALANGTI